MEKIKEIAILPLVYLALLGMFAAMLIIRAIDILFYPSLKPKKQRSYFCPMDPHP